MSCFSRRGGSSSLEAQGKQTRRKRKFEEVLPWPSSLSCRACACVPCRGARCLGIQPDYYKCMEFFSRLPGQKAPLARYSPPLPSHLLSGTEFPKPGEAQAEGGGPVHAAV